ncbi:MAG: ATP-binding protein, partial [Anaerolineae bacterium]|nr:ATP-binding protein [Anaerolineae bacterium]
MKGFRLINHYSDSPIYMVVGPPAVGKSTTSRALAAQFPRSIHIPVDDLRNMVVSGLILPSAVWSKDLAQQITLARSTVSLMALAYQNAGFAVVIDDFWDANHTSDYQTLLDQTQAMIKRLFEKPVFTQPHPGNLTVSCPSPI